MELGHQHHSKNKAKLVGNREEKGHHRESMPLCSLILGWGEIPLWRSQQRGERELRAAMSCSWANKTGSSES